MTWRHFGLPFTAGIFLLVAAVKLWATDQGLLLAAAFLGAGFVVVGLAVYEWIDNRSFGGQDMMDSPEDYKLVWALEEEARKLGWHRTKRNVGSRKVMMVFEKNNEPEPREGGLDPA